MKKIIFIGFCLLLHGCHVGPRYKTPSSAIPSQWKSTQIAPTVATNIEYWWEIFNDSSLDTLEKKAIARNYNLYIALEKVAEARAIAGARHADLYPQIALNGGYNYSQDQVKAHTSRKAKALGFLDSIQIREQSYMFPNILSYELDLWGKYRGEYKAALFNAQAEQDNAKAVLLTLTSELASNYFNLRAIDTQIHLLNETLILLNGILNFHTSRYKVGIDNYIDIAQAEKTLEIIKAEYEESLLQRSLFENAIATLVGVPASEFHIESNLLEENVPIIPSGIPSSILTKRPDIAQAERTMASKHALINVAYSSFFPALQLTGGLGFSSIQLKHFLSLKNYLFQFGANILQSIFDAGRNRSNLDAAKARFQQAEGSYQEVILKAFREVEDSLSSIEYQEKKSRQLEKAFIASQKIALLSNKRYKVGIVNELEVLNNKKSLIDVHRLWIMIIDARYQSTISLIKSLGGSWESTKAPTKEKGRSCQCDKSN